MTEAELTLDKADAANQYNHVEQAEIDGTTIDSLIKIGRIILKHGTDSVDEGGIVSERRKSITIPLLKGLSCEAVVGIPKDELSRTLHRITLILSGPAPRHYKERQARRKSITLVGKQRWDKYHSIRVRVNKFFYPEAKDFERPELTEFEKIEKRYGWAIPVSYVNNDGQDIVEVEAPIDRVGKKTLTFATEFAAQALKLFQDYYQKQTTTKNQMPELSESNGTMITLIS